MFKRFEKQNGKLIAVIDGKPQTIYHFKLGNKRGSKISIRAYSQRTSNGENLSVIAFEESFKEGEKVAYLEFHRELPEAQKRCSEIQSELELLKI